MQTDYDTSKAQVIEALGELHQRGFVNDYEVREFEDDVLVLEIFLVNTGEEG